VPTLSIVAKHFEPTYKLNESFRLRLKPLTTIAANPPTSSESVPGSGTGDVVELPTVTDAGASIKFPFEIKSAIGSKFAAPGSTLYRS
jgi:hypothetical protein